MLNTLKKLLALLDPDDRRAFGLFVLISFLAGVIEVAGIGSVMPFIAVLMQPGLVTTNRALSHFYTALHFSSSSQFIVFMGGATLAVIIAGGVINILAVRYQLSLSYRIGYKWATRLFSAYLGQPYRFYLDTNSNVMKSNILSEVDRAVTWTLLPASILISKLMIVLVIFVLLLFVNPAVTIILMLLVGGIYGALLLYFRRRMHRHGGEITVQNKIRFRVTGEAFASIRDIKLYNSAGYFERKFSEAAEKYNMDQASGLYYGQIPRFIIEIFGFAALIGVALYLIVLGETPAGHVIPLIALFAAAGYKTLPAAQNLYQAINNLRLHGAALSAVAEGIALGRGGEESSDAPGKEISFAKEIRLNALGFSYGGDQGVPILRDVNCDIQKNTLVAVIGPTGAGKSTLIDLLAGLLQSSQGEILIDGRALGPDNVKAWQRQIGYVPQKIHLLDESVQNNIAFAVPADRIDPDRVAAAAAEAQIDAFIRTLPRQYNTVVGEQGDRLSGGQRQRIGIARALYRNSAVLILDEPTSALDTETARNLLATLKTLSQEKTVIVITHSLEVLQYCDQILFVNAGRVTSGESYESLMNDNPFLSGLLEKAR